MFLGLRSSLGHIPQQRWGPKKDKCWKDKQKLTRATKKHEAKQGTKRMADRRGREERSNAKAQACWDHTRQRQTQTHQTNKEEHKHSRREQQQTQMEVVDALQMLSTLERANKLNVGVTTVLFVDSFHGCVCVLFWCIWIVFHPFNNKTTTAHHESKGETGNVRMPTDTK